MALTLETTSPRMPDEANRLLLVALPEPPLAVAYHHWDEATRTLTYTYNGRRLITIHIPGSDRVSFRHGSDGGIQSWPLHQQVYIMLSGAPVKAAVTFELSADAVNMRPERAGREDAILGQVGRPLLPGANGLYDIHDDLLIEWHGQPWQWTGPRMEAAGGDDAGAAPSGEETPLNRRQPSLRATMTVELGPLVWTLTIKPHYYRTHLGYEYHRPWRRRPQLRPIVGWCTWEAHRRNLTQEKIAAAADFFARHLRAYGFEYVQVDDGYERLPLPVDLNGTVADAWLTTTEHFPEGHSGIVRAIRARGLEPGIWTSAAVYNDAWADRNPEHLLKDASGQPLLGDWVKYVLDCTPEALERHVRPVYEGLRRFGYTYFKIDAIRHLHFDGLHEAALLGLLSNEEAEARYRRFLEVAREGLGEDVYWLSSWGIMTQMVGLADACRISQDAMPTWAGMQMQLVESARWFFTQRILWLNDPDHVCVRAPLEWARTVLSMVALTGGLFMLSDALEHYDEPRLELVRKCIPPLTTMTAETGPLDTDYAAYTWTKFHGFHVLQERPFDAETMTDEEARNQAGDWATIDAAHPFATLWAIHLDNAVGRWCVAGRFAAIALGAARLDFARLALQPGRDYLVFDFWQERYLGRFRGGVDVPALALGHCQVLAIRPALGHPQLLSSTRHVSQDAVSVRRQAWRGDTLELDLDGVCGTTESYWLHVPAGYQPVDLATVASPATDAPAPEASSGRAAPHITLVVPDPATEPADAGGGRAWRLRVEFPRGEQDRTQSTLRVRFRKQTP